MGENYLSEALYEKAEAIFSQKDYSKALQLLQKAVKHLEDQQSPLKGQIYLLLIKTHFAMIQYREAHSLALEVLDFFKQYGSSLERTRVYRVLGKIQSQLGKYSEAIQYYQKAIDLLPTSFLTLEEAQLKAKTYLNLGGAIQYHSDLSKQHKYFCRSLFIGQRIHDQKLIAQALLGLGCCFFQKEKYHIARKLLLKALKFFHTIDELRDSARTLLFLGQVYMKTYEYHRAVNALRLAYSLFEQGGDSINQAHSLVFLARIYLKIDPEKGRELSEQATHLLSTQTSAHKKRQSEIVLGHSCIVMGLYYASLNQPEIACTYLKESMEIFQLYHCDAALHEADKLFQEAKQKVPIRKTRKNNLLAFKLGMST